MKYEQAKKLVRKNLSEKRYTHTKNVKKMAVKLAKRWGADPEKAALAAILHDAAKELPKDRQLQIFAEKCYNSRKCPHASHLGVARHRRRHPVRDRMGRA